MNYFFYKITRTKIWCFVWCYHCIFMFVDQFLFNKGFMVYFLKGVYVVPF